MQRILVDFVVDDAWFGLLGLPFDVWLGFNVLVFLLFAFGVFVALCVFVCVCASSCFCLMFLWFCVCIVYGARLGLLVL